MAKRTGKSSPARKAKGSVAENKFYFGAQYFRPPTPLKQDWKRDFESMAACGMNIVRMWVLWSWHEPAEGQYDWTDIEDLLAECRKHKIKAILLMSLESTPAWLNKRYPEAKYEGHDGTIQWPDGFGNHPSGYFPGLNFDYPEVRDHAERFLRAIVSRFKGDSAVWGWEPHNEPIIEPARMKFDREQVYSYNQPSIDHFRLWCKRRYESIDKLNAAWHRTYGDWSEIEPPRRIPGGTAADFLDWSLHNMEALVERVQWRADVMRDEDPDIHLMIHTRAYTCTQGNPATWGMDDWRLAQICDTWGGSSFYRRWPDAGYFLNNDCLYSSAQGKEFWLSEVQGGPPGGGLSRPGGTDYTRGDYTPERFTMWTLMPVAQGAKGFMYWQFRMERKGPEYGFGVTNIDGSWSPRTHRAKELGEFFHKNKKLLLEAEIEPLRVAIGYNPHSPCLEFIHTWRVWDYAESLMGAYKAALHLDYGSYFLRLDEEAVDEDFGRFDLITIPMGMWISPKAVKKLKTFVRDGGTLVADASLGEYTHDGLLWSETVPGFGLDEVFGVRRTEVVSHAKVGEFPVDTARPVVHSIGPRDMRTCRYEEWLEPTSADVIGAWPAGQPAVTVNRYGKGKAVYIGSNATLAYSHNEDPALLELYRQLTADIPLPARTGRTETHVRTLHRGKQRLYFVFNYSPTRVSDVLTIEKSPQRLKNLMTGEKVAFDKADGAATVRMDLPGYETLVLLAE